MAKGKTTLRKGKTKEDRTIEDSINRRSIEGERGYGKTRFIDGRTHVGGANKGGVISDMVWDGLIGDSTIPVNHRAGYKKEGKNLTRVGMGRDNGDIAIRNDYDDGDVQIIRYRGKNYNSMPGVPKDLTTKTTRKTTKKTASKPTTSKASTAKKDDLKKTAKKTTTTKKTTKKR